MNCCEQTTKPVSEKFAQSKVHIHLHTTDLGKSTAFYRSFFGEDPVKQFPEYSKFLPSWAPVNLALSFTAHQERGSTVSHFGIQLPDRVAVLEHLKRIKTLGLAVREEMNVNCCHANQDKFWVQDPMGVEWEVYYLNYDLQNAPAATPATACCAK